MIGKKNLVFINTDVFIRLGASKRDDTVRDIWYRKYDFVLKIIWELTAVSF